MEKKTLFSLIHSTIHVNMYRFIYFGEWIQKDAFSVINAVLVWKTSKTD